MVTRKKSESKNGLVKKSNAPFTTLIDGEMTEIMAIQLGVEVSGKVKTSADGQYCMDGDLNLPKWKQPAELAIEIGGLTEKINGYPLGTVKYVPRLRSIEGGFLVAEIILMAKEVASLTLRKAKSAAQHFLGKTTIQAELPWSSASDQKEVSTEDMKIIDDSAAGFLKAYGGKPIRSPMRVNVGGEVIAGFSGVWKNPKKDDPSKDEKISIEGFYDGRRLRQRCFYIIEATKKARCFEIYYDDNLFDEKFRSLNDNKEASIKLKCRMKLIGKKEQLFLAELTISSDPNEVEFSLT